MLLLEVFEVLMMSELGGFLFCLFLISYAKLYVL